MQIIPVIDIRNGVAVRAVAGERGRYQPLQSRLTTSTEPAEVLRALQGELGCETCYVADLDGIERGLSNRCTVAEMIRTGVKVILDAGVHTKDDVHQWLEIGLAHVVISSESFPEIQQLAAICSETDADQLAFSVDLKQGRLWIADQTRQTMQAMELAREVVAQGIRNLIVLDLASVGVGRGISTLSLCQNIKQQWPHLRLISGGGVDGIECLRSAREAQLDGLLIASALHDGRLNTSNLQEWNLENE